MERIADASLSVLIPIHNSTWIEFLTNGEGRQVTDALEAVISGSAHFVLGRGVRHPTIFRVISVGVIVRLGKSSREFQTFQGQCRSRSVSQSVLVFFGLTSQPAGRISPLQDNRVSWPAIDQ